MWSRRIPSSELAVHVAVVVGAASLQHSHLHTIPDASWKTSSYNNLIRRGYSVDVGVVVDRRNGGYVQKEVDFLVNHGDRKLYIQSAFQMDTEQKESTELDSLTLTGDFFKKTIIRTDIPHNFYDDNGTFHCNLIDFLLEWVELF